MVVSVPIHFFGIDVTQLTPVTVIIKIFCALLCSGILGFQRTRKRRPAGVRTYMLVCLGATLTLMTSQFINVEIGHTDLSRLGAQVISGIGFLGAGTILFTGYKQIKGLTTAAGLWASACLGLAIGAGFIYGALITCAAIFFCMTVMGYVEHIYIMHAKSLHLYVLFSSVTGLEPFLNYLKEHNFTIEEFETLTRQESTQSVLFALTYKHKTTHEEIIHDMENCEQVILVEEY